MDVSSAGLQAFLFALFAGLNAILAAITGPAYDHLLVPELQTSSLFPPLVGGGSGSFLGTAASFSGYLLVNLVDPAIALVGLGVALAYLGRAFLGRWATAVEPLLARLVLSVLIANFSLPIAGAILDLAASVFPIIAGYDGGLWEHWVYLAGVGEARFSWDNGVLAFVLSFALFSLVLLLSAAVALRDAMLAVLLVLLPLFTLCWPIPPIASLARRAWLLFAELAFLPCVLVIPLELAVGAPSILLLLGYLTAALSTPALLSVAGSQLQAIGFPSAGGAVTGGMQRGLASASSAGGNWLRPMGGLVPSGSGAQAAVGAAGRGLSAGSFPGTLPLLAADFLGKGTAHLVRHLRATGAAGTDRFPAVGSRAARGGGLLG